MTKTNYIIIPFSGGFETQPYGGASIFAGESGISMLPCCSIPNTEETNEAVFPDPTLYRWRRIAIVPSIAFVKIAVHIPNPGDRSWTLIGLVVIPASPKPFVTFDGVGNQTGYTDDGSYGAHWGLPLAPEEGDSVDFDYQISQCDIHDALASGGYASFSDYADFVVANIVLPVAP